MIQTNRYDALANSAMVENRPTPQGMSVLRRKAQEAGPRKAIIALARKLLVVAWRMLQTGEVYRAARATTVTRKQRELQMKSKIQMGSMLLDEDLACTTPRVRARAKRMEGLMNRRRTPVSA